MLLENNGLHIGCVDHHVDDGEFRVWKFLRDLFNCRCMAEADRENRRETVFRKASQSLFALCIILDFKVAEIDP